MLRSLFRAALVLTLFAASGSLAAQTLTETQVKAAYLFNFAKFVKWPSGSHASAPTFNICILGSNPFGKTLQATIVDERLEGKSITTRSIAGPADAADCSIVFLGRSEHGRLGSLLPALAKQGVLTVSEAPRFIERGGMIGFVMEGDRIRFEVNLTAAQKAGLSLSSELLKVALNVKRDPDKGGH